MIPFTKEQYNAKAVELDELEPGSQVEALDGTRWVKDWGGLWYSKKPWRANSIALVSEFNPSEDVVDKNKKPGLGMSLFD